MWLAHIISKCMIGACSPRHWVCWPTDEKPTKSQGPKQSHLQRECNYLVRSLLLNQRHDRIRHRHPHCALNVPSSGISAILSDGSSDTINTLHAGHTHQSLGRWHVRSHAHNSSRLGQWRQQWQPIDSATSLFLSFTFFVIYLPTMAQ